MSPDGQIEFAKLQADVNKLTTTIDYKFDLHNRCEQCILCCGLAEDSIIKFEYRF